MRFNIGEAVLIKSEDAGEAYTVVAHHPETEDFFEYYTIRTIHSNHNDYYIDAVGEDLTRAP